jgi:hypothetical protein
MRGARLPQYLIAASCAVLFAAPPSAGAVALSHGIQHLPITQDECLRRGTQVLQAEGYGQPAPANPLSGFKGPHGVYLVCTARSANETAVTIFVATENTSDGNLPGAERVRLQDRMAAASPSPGPGPGPAPAACQGFSGVWAMSGFGEATLAVDATGRVTGTYTNGGGRIDAQVNGDRLSGSWSQPGRTGGVQATLAPDGRIFICRWTENGRDAGGCDASCRGSAVAPPPPPVAAASGWAGSWDSSYGRMDIQVRGNQVTGTYTQPAGRIEATAQGSVIEGRWIQGDRSGRMRFTLAPDGRSFAGAWTEMDGRGGGNWGGTRR